MSRPVSSGSQRHRKSRLRELLLERDFEAVVDWIREDRHVVRSISGSLFDQDRLVCWRAIEALGRVAPIVAASDLEKVRVMVRRLLWQMNDESGNVGWYAAEAVGEILVNVPQLIPEYGRILVSYLVEEPFERGAAWAIWRIAGVQPEIYRDSVEALTRHVQDRDPFVRAHAFRALLLVAPHETGAHRDSLASDATSFEYYCVDSGSFVETTVAEAALESRTNTAP